METLFGLSEEQSLKLFDAGSDLIRKLGYDVSKPEGSVGLQVSVYLQALAMDALLEDGVSAGREVPKSCVTAASDIRRQSLRSLRKYLRRKPCGDDLLERLKPHCEISEEAAAVIRQDVERLVASLP